MKTTISHLRQIGWSLFETLRTASADGVGVTRDSYGPGETTALELIRRFAASEGFHSECDRGGNLLVSLDAHRSSATPILIASHLDSVPQGGNYDGAAGIVAGLLCLVRLRDEGISAPVPIKVLCLRGEESAWFGKASIGSNALFGQLTGDELGLCKRQTTSTLRECMKAIGADVDAIAANRPFVLPQDVAGYLELHIEQGAVMVSRGFATAVVPAIRGNVRHNHVRCLGEAAHSGATPRWLRRDAVFAIADLLMRLDEHWRVLLERGLDLVVTAGMIGTNPAEHAVSRVPGEATFSLEIRSQSHETLEAFYRLVQAECAGIAAARKVKFVFDLRVDSLPARMNERIVSTLLDLSRSLGLPTELVPSGPGHDASVFANNGVPAGMIFVRNENGSHNPNETMALDDFMAGVELLYAACTAPKWLS
jgi:beta-ureidopropionase / N-carbamoyl-L-amino-acid hydrolase